MALRARKQEKGAVPVENPKRKAIFLDIDGTLIGKGDRPSQYDIDQLVAARKQGHMFFLNTGRSYGFLPQSLRTADYIDGVITREQFWVLAKFKYPTHQIAFCTENALKCLEYRDCEVL